MNLETKHGMPSISRWRAYALILKVIIVMCATFALAPAQAQVSSDNTRVLSLNVPDETRLARLVWTTMIALDNANRTDNYSVLYSLGSPGFQASNTPQVLRTAFARLRQNRVDIGRTLLINPTYYIPPAIDEKGRLRLRGGFDFRPKAIRFDILFTRAGTSWRVHALSVVEMDVNARR